MEEYQIVVVNKIDKIFTLLTPYLLNIKSLSDKELFKVNSKADDILKILDI